MQGVHQPFPEAVSEAGAQLCPGEGVQQPPGQPALHLAPDHDRRPGKRAYLCSYLFSLLFCRQHGPSVCTSAEHHIAVSHRPSLPQSSGRELDGNEWGQCYQDVLHAKLEGARCMGLGSRRGGRGRCVAVGLSGQSAQPQDRCAALHCTRSVHLPKEIQGERLKIM